uniref:Domain of unknown function DB domain-containing protein n=1 Tax=Acrobeloides nanus TaxID=290746 RepID=A0A914DDI9_9BILA
MCPNACSPCFGNQGDNRSNTNKNESPNSPSVSPPRVAAGQTSYVPNSQQSNTIQQTIPNNAGNGPPLVLQQTANVGRQAYNNGVPQTSIQQQPYQPTNNAGPPVFQQTPNQGAQFPSGAQQFSAPQTLAPYQPFSGFSPFSVPSQSPFFNPFVPTSFSPAAFSVAPFGGLTFAPPASFGPAFTPAPIIFPQTAASVVPPSISQQAVPSYQPYQQVPQSVSQPLPQPTYTQNQSYRIHVTEHATNYNNANQESSQRIQSTFVRQPPKQYSTTGNANGQQQSGRYSTNTNVNPVEQGKQPPARYIPTYNQQARPKQIHSTQTSYVNRGNAPPPAPIIVSPNVQPAPQVSQTNPPAIVQGIPHGITIQPPTAPPESIINNNLPIGNHIDTQPFKIDKATCPRQPNWEPCISKELANERFRNCCQRLGEGCAQLCTYDQNLATLQIAVLTGRCPIGKVADMMICASGYEDATPCCEAYGVFEPGFQHCRPYCNPAAGLPNDGMIAEKYRCLGKLSQIQRCFYVTQRP